MNIHKWLCKFLGHKWGNRGIPEGILKTIDGEEMVTLTCRRCGEKQESSISFVTENARLIEDNKRLRKELKRRIKCQKIK